MIGAHNSSLVSMASVSSYYGGCATKILQLNNDSLWWEYIPRDSAYVDTALRHLALENIDTGGGGAYPFLNISNNALRMDWKIFPNPASVQLNVVAEDGAITDNSALQYKIHDLIGNEVGSGSFMAGNKETVIDISSLSPGIFIIEISNTKSLQNYKFVHQ